MTDTSTPTISPRAADRNAIEPTYGGLIAQEQTAFTVAVNASSRRPESPQAAHQEVLGLERYLRVAGHHLDLLANLNHSNSEGWRELAQRLSRLPVWDLGDGNWARAATLLGTAHDLLAAHVGPRHSPRTPEADDLEGQQVLSSSGRNLADQVAIAATAGTELLNLTAARQRHSTVRPTSKQEFGTLRVVLAQIPVCASAARWDLREVSPELQAALRDLTLPAAVRTTLGPDRSQDAHALVRLLRRLSREQSRGDLPASAASLRDLALLGATVTAPAARDVTPSGPTGLERLEWAHEQDRLDSAHRQWRDLATLLEGEVHGLSKAPVAYALTVQQLRALDSPKARQVVINALPALSRQAAEIVRELARQRSLATAQRTPPEMHPAWRPLPASDGEALAQAFLEGGRATTAPALRAQNGRASTAPVLTHVWDAHGRTVPLEVEA